MNVNVLYRGRAAMLASAELFEELLDFVESLPEAHGRFPQLMRCEGSGVYFSRREAGALAIELLQVLRALEEWDEKRAADFQPIVDRLARIAFQCVATGEPVYLEVTTGTASPVEAGGQR